MKNKLLTILLIVLAAQELTALWPNPALLKDIYLENTLPSDKAECIIQDDGSTRKEVFSFDEKAKCLAVKFAEPIRIPWAHSYKPSKCITIQLARGKDIYKMYVVDYRFRPSIRYINDNRDKNWSDGDNVKKATSTQGPYVDTNNMSNFDLIANLFDYNLTLTHFDPL